MDKCKLCGSVADLCDSHLISSAVYPLLKSAIKDPVMVTPQVAMHTSRQTKTYLLCPKCEDVLNRGGEMWVVPLLATVEGKFPLFDMIAKVAPEVDEPDAKAYAAVRNPQIRFEKILHFAAGIFWKASVHSWSGTEKGPLIELGPYGEELRVFLLGEQPFPKAVTLHMFVIPPPVKMIAVNLPIKPRSTGFRSYSMYVPGIDFWMCVGKGIPRDLRRTCLYRNPGHPILVFADTEGKLAKDMHAALSGTAHKSRKLLEWLRGPRLG